MPSNLYGVANAPALAVKATFGGVICPAGVETNLISSPPLVAPSQGYFYVVCNLMIFVAYQPTLPSAVTFAARIGAGADFDSYPVNLANVAVSTGFEYSLTLISPAFSIPWLGAGSVVNTTANPTGFQINTTGIGSQCWFMLVRAPDQ